MIGLVSNTLIHLVGSVPEASERPPAGKKEENLLTKYNVSWVGRAKASSRKVDLYSGAEGREL